ncbi:hypothetical protein [Fodinicola feengrottensis]|uniref:hypothetical protein n=1 Tax=Fodinicola feengrottensis TaxID=435914 RepID=UPI0013D0D862|nr:hypothetical protein [Fodinicola feengrottensis]
METTTADVQLKINRLDNDVHAIYGLLEKIEKTQEKQGATLEALSQSQTRMQVTQMRENNRINELTGTYDDLSASNSELAVIQRRQAHRLDEFAHRLDQLSGSQTQLLNSQAQLASNQMQFVASQAEHGKKLDKVLVAMAGKNGTAE